MGRAHIAIDGEIDVTNAARFGATLLEALNGASAELIIDASAVTFIDSCGVRELLRAQARAAQLDIAFGVSNPSPAMRRVLELTDVAGMIVDGRVSPL